MASFRVRGKIFATVPDDTHLRVMVDEMEIRAAVAANPDACQELYWGKRLACRGRRPPPCQSRPGGGTAHRRLDPQGTQEAGERALRTADRHGSALAPGRPGASARAVLSLGPDVGGGCRRRARRGAGGTMGLQVVGAGVGRTGTLSLKTGLEQLTGQPCYHMLEVFGHPDHVALWRDAAEGGNGRLGGDARRVRIDLGLPGLSVLARDPRGQPRRRGRAVDPTRQPRPGGRAPARPSSPSTASTLPPEMADWFEMWRAVASARFTADWTDKDAAIAAYERHNAEVRASAPGITARGLASGRRMEAAVRRAGCGRARRAVPASQHQGGLPHGRCGHDR